MKSAGRGVAFCFAALRFIRLLLFVVALSVGIYSDDGVELTTGMARLHFTLQHYLKCRSYIEKKRANMTAMKDAQKSTSMRAWSSELWQSTTNDYLKKKLCCLPCLCLFNFFFTDNKAIIGMVYVSWWCELYGSVFGLIKRVDSYIFSCWSVF